METEGQQLHLRKVASEKRAKLAVLLDRLKQGKNVQNRDLKTWLGAELYANFESMQRGQAELREELATKPAEIVEYERRLKAALFSDNKAEGYSTRGKAKAAAKARHKAEVLFEHALEYLQELVEADPALQMWFDRATDWTIDGEVSACAASMPRVVTSKSADNRGGGITSRKQSVREMKIYAIEIALAQMAADETVNGEMSAEAKRAAMLKLLGRG